MTWTFWVQRWTTSLRLPATTRKAPSTNRLTAMVPTESAFMRRLRQRLVKASWKKYARARKTAITGGIIIPSHVGTGRDRRRHGLGQDLLRPEDPGPRGARALPEPEPGLVLQGRQRPRPRGPGRDQLRPPRRLRHLAPRPGPARPEGGTPRPLPHLRPCDLLAEGPARSPHRAARHHPGGHTGAGGGAAAPAHGHQALHRHRLGRAHPAPAAAGPEGAGPLLRVREEAVPGVGPADAPRIRGALEALRGPDRP